MFWRLSILAAHKVWNEGRFKLVLLKHSSHRDHLECFDPASKDVVFRGYIGGRSIPLGSCVPVRRAGAAPAEGRPSNSRGGTLTWRGGAESRADTSRDTI